MLKRHRGIYRRKGRTGFYAWVPIAGQPRPKQRLLGKTREEALRRLRDIQADGGEAAALTVDRACKRWLGSYIATRRNEKGRRMAELWAGKYLLTWMGPRQLARITREDLRSYRLWVEEHELSPQTVAHILSDARCFLLWAEEEGFLNRSPFPRRLMPRVQQSLRRHFTEDEVKILYALPEPIGFTCRLGIESGLRWSELCRADRSHFDGKAISVAHTKGGRVRRVPLPAFLCDEIHYRVGRLVHRSEGASGSFSRSVRLQSGIVGFHAHAMRHTYAHRFLARGGSTEALKEMLGHRDFATTFRYLTGVPQLARQEAERIADLSVPSSVPGELQNDKATTR
ncbi:MAG: tyrosine-type recombinase/integrase [Candidatus Eisenbacteria bacterium]